MRARAFLARSKLGGRLGRGDRDVGPNLESSLTFRPAWGRIATRFETLQVPALGGSPGRSAIVDRLAGTDRKRHRPRPDWDTSYPWMAAVPPIPRPSPRHRVTLTSRSRWPRGSSGPISAVLDHHRLAPPANSSDVTINNESMTFQLFGDLTPQTVARIATLTNDNYYTTTTLPVQARLAPVSSSRESRPCRPARGSASVQGGSSSATSTSSSSGVTPIATEIVQQLAFTGQYQLAMANTGAAEQHRRAVLHHQRHSLAVHSAAALISITRSSASSSRASKR